MNFPGKKMVVLVKVGIHHELLSYLIHGVCVFSRAAINLRRWMSSEIIADWDAQTEGVNPNWWDLAVNPFNLRSTDDICLAEKVSFTLWKLRRGWSRCMHSKKECFWLEHLPIQVGLANLASLRLAPDRNEQRKKDLPSLILLSFTDIFTCVTCLKQHITRKFLSVKNLC